MSADGGVVVVCGANGFLGRYLCRGLARRGWEVAAVARRRDGWGGDGMFLPWDGCGPGPWMLALEGAEAVINVAGTPAHNGAGDAAAAAIAAAVAACRVPPRLWLNAGPAAIYAETPAQPADEWSGEPGTSARAAAARAAEDRFFGLRLPGRVRKLQLRLAMVLAAEPGTAMASLTRLAGHGLGGTTLTRRPALGWLHMHDFLAAVDWMIRRRDLDGPVNVCAPRAAAWRTFWSAVRLAAGVSAGVPLPRRLLAALARRPGHALGPLVDARWTVPARLIESGFQFRWTDPHAALADLVRRPGLDAFFSRPEAPRTLRPQCLTTAAGEAPPQALHHG